MTAKQPYPQERIYYTNPNGYKAKGIHGGPSKHGHKDSEQDDIGTACKMKPHNESVGDAAPTPD